MVSRREADNPCLPGSRGKPPWTKRHATRPERGRPKGVLTWRARETAKRPPRPELPKAAARGPAPARFAAPGIRSVPGRHIGAGRTSRNGNPPKRRAHPPPGRPAGPGTSCPPPPAGTFPRRRHINGCRTGIMEKRGAYKSPRFSSSFASFQSASISPRVISFKGRPRRMECRST